MCEGFTLSLIMASKNVAVALGLQTVGDLPDVECLPSLYDNRDLTVMDSSCPPLPAAPLYRSGWIAFRASLLRTLHTLYAGELGPAATWAASTASALSEGVSSVPAPPPVWTCFQHGISQPRVSLFAVLVPGAAALTAALACVQALGPVAAGGNVKDTLAPLCAAVASSLTALGDALQAVVRSNASGDLKHGGDIEALGALVEVFALGSLTVGGLNSAVRTLPRNAAGPLRVPLKTATERITALAAEAVKALDSKVVPPHYPKAVADSYAESLRNFKEVLSGLQCAPIERST